MYGPIGPKVSKPLPLSQVRPLFFWKFLSLTSLTKKKPRIWSSAWSSLTYKAFFPITNPNSTSQSVCWEFFGIIIPSLGPVIQFVNLEKIIGSFGIGSFCSSAWSLKFNPIPINFDGLETQGPILSLGFNLFNLLKQFN